MINGILFVKVVYLFRIIYTYTVTYKFQTRFRSHPLATVLNSQSLAALFIKCRRLLKVLNLYVSSTRAEIVPGQGHFINMKVDKPLIWEV